MTSLFDFDGSTYEPMHDRERLNTQMERVKALMLDGKWRTLGEIQDVAGGSEAAISARLRDLRKERFGGYDVERMRIDGGLFAYRVRKVLK